MLRGLRRVLLSALRLVFVVVGGGVATLALLSLVSSPSGDGFVSAGSWLVLGSVTVLGLGTAALGVSLPTLVGAKDSLGFSSHQRTLLIASAGTVVGGVLVTLLAVSANAFFGILLGLFVVFLGVCGAFLAVGWRLTAVLSDRYGATDTG